MLRSVHLGRFPQNGNNPADGGYTLLACLLRAPINTIHYTCPEELSTITDPNIQGSSTAFSGFCPDCVLVITWNNVGHVRGDLSKTVSVNCPTSVRKAYTRLESRHTLPWEMKIWVMSSQNLYTLIIDL